MMNKQIQSSEMIIQATKSQNIVTNVIWVILDPGIVGMCNAHCVPKGKLTNPILPNDNPNH